MELRETTWSDYRLITVRKAPSDVRLAARVEDGVPDAEPKPIKIRRILLNNSTNALDDAKNAREKASYTPSVRSNKRKLTPSNFALLC
jgi:hypothetical protein